MKLASAGDSLRACGVGMFLGASVRLAEGLGRGMPIAPEGVAAYGLLCGLSLMLPQLLVPAGLAGGRVRAGLETLIAAAWFALPLGYIVNVDLLAGEPFTSTRSLLADVAVVAGALFATFKVRTARHLPRSSDQVRAWTAISSLALASALTTVVWAWPAPPQAPERGGSGPDLLLVAMDSVRRDHLGLHDHALPTSPSIDAWARGGRGYSRAFSASSWTAPSVERLLRGAPNAPQHVAELLAERGYVSACYSDNPHLGRGAGLTQGFDRVERSVGAWRRLLRRTTLVELLERLEPGRDEDLVVGALKWARSVKSPRFLYVHLMDAHAPYEKPPIDGRTRPGRRIVFPLSGMRISAEEAEDVRARYDGGIRSVDTSVGRLLEGFCIKERPCLVILTADHGESLGEQGRWFHGRSLAPELLAVPLVLVGPGVIPGVVESPVGHDSVRRTLLAAAGVACPACRGSDLRTSEGDPVVEGWLPPFSAYRVEGHHKLVVDRAGRHRLFDLSADPAELHEIAAQYPDLVATLGAGFEVPRASVSQPSPEDVERLKALGYVGH